jgi:hypothetical protein
MIKVYPQVDALDVEYYRTVFFMYDDHSIPLYMYFVLTSCASRI